MRLLIPFILTISFIFTGCISMVAGMAATGVTDHGVYGQVVSLPAQLRFRHVNITSINGDPVNWRSNGPGISRVTLPAGGHSLVFNWVQANPAIRIVPDAMITTWSITTRDFNNISLSVDFKSGHNYFLDSFPRDDGSLMMVVTDITNAPDNSKGDDVRKAPRASGIPTEFEGIWMSDDGIALLITGNTWEQIQPPGTGMNNTHQTISTRGTFAVGDSITLYTTGFAAGMDRWRKLRSSLRFAYIYTYSFEADRLYLEINDYMHRAVYTKR